MTEHDHVLQSRFCLDIKMEKALSVKVACTINMERASRENFCSVLFFALVLYFYISFQLGSLILIYFTRFYVLHFKGVLIFFMQLLCNYVNPN